MKHSGDDIERIRSEGLRSRFEASEAPVDDSIYKRIRKELGRSDRLAALTVLLALLLSGFLVWKNKADRFSKLPQARTESQATHGKQPSVFRSGIEIGSRSFDKPVDLSFSKTKLKTGPAQSIAQTERDLHLAKTIVSADFPQSDLPSIAHTNRDVKIKLEETALENRTFEPIFVKTLKPRPFSSNTLLELPKLKTASPNTPVSTTRTNVSLILAFSPMQNFQALRVQSPASYRDIRFPSVLSFQAKTFQLSVGAEAKGFQLLVHYAYWQNRIFYQRGTGRYDIEPAPNGTDKISEITISEVLDERLQRMGIGIHKIFAPRSGPFRSYELTIGTQYDRILVPGQHVFWANGGLLKRVCISGDTHLMLGPYAQIGLNNQQASISGWQYRPVQVGMTATFKLNPFKSNYYLTK